MPVRAGRGSHHDAAIHSAALRPAGGGAGGGGEQPARVCRGAPERWVNRVVCMHVCLAWHLGWLASGAVVWRAFNRFHHFVQPAAEVVLGTVRDVSLAIAWLKTTFLYVRIRKNPARYGWVLGWANACQTSAHLVRMGVRTAGALLQAPFQPAHPCSSLTCLQMEPLSLPTLPQPGAAPWHAPVRGGPHPEGQAGAQQREGVRPPPQTHCLTCVHVLCGACCYAHEHNGVRTLQPVADRAGVVQLQAALSIHAAPLVSSSPLPLLC